MVTAQMFIEPGMFVHNYPRQMFCAIAIFLSLDGFGLLVGLADLFSGAAGYSLPL